MTKKYKKKEIRKRVWVDVSDKENIDIWSEKAVENFKKKDIGTNNLIPATLIYKI